MALQYSNEIRIKTLFKIVFFVAVETDRKLSNEKLAFFVENIRYRNYLINLRRFSPKEFSLPTSHTSNRINFKLNKKNKVSQTSPVKQMIPNAFLRGVS